MTLLDDETNNIFPASLRHSLLCKEINTLSRLFQQVRNKERPIKIERDVYFLKDHSVLLMDYHPIQGGAVTSLVATCRKKNRVIFDPKAEITP